MKCRNCGKELSFWGTFIGYCGDCKNKVGEAKQLLKENNFESIDTLNYFCPHDTKYNELFLKKDKMLTFEDGKVIYDALIRDLVATNNNEDTLRKFCEGMVVELEKKKIESRQKQLSLKHRAEKEYFGKERTKRVGFTNDEKEDILNKFDNKCALCNTEEGLHIHHKDNNSRNNQLDNLIVLCGLCHKKIHMRVR